MELLHGKLKNLSRKRRFGDFRNVDVARIRNNFTNEFNLIAFNFTHYQISKLSLPSKRKAEHDLESAEPKKYTKGIVYGFANFVKWNHSNEII